MRLLFVRRLKYIVYTIVLVGFLAVLLLPKNVNAGVNDFTIKSFEADYYLNKNEQGVSTMKVVEKIVAEFPNFDQNHGILRAIPDEYKDQSLGLSVESVKNQYGHNYKYSTSTSSGNKVLKIGDANSYAYGETTYVITYSLRNVIAFEDGHNELYWDVNGDQWPQEFGLVTARVHIPQELAASLQDRQLCFAGTFRANNANCTISRATGSNGEVIVTTQAQDLSGYQTLTYVLAFNDNTFHPYVPSTWERIWPLLFISPIVVLPFITFAIVYSKWVKYGRDPKGKGVIVPQYTPPKHFNSLMSDVLLKERLDTKAISAQIIELAVRGYVAIYEIKEKKILKDKDDYELELLKDTSQLTKEEDDVIRMFFGDAPVPGQKVKLSTLKTKLHSKVDALGKHVSEKLYNQQYFSNDPHKAKKKYAGAGILLLILGFVLCFTIVGLIIGIGLVISAIILLIGSRAMPARSASGVEVRDYLLGLRDYMNLAEADRIKFLQSPEGVKQYGDPAKPANKIKLFEKLLPYAMLFGIEKNWAKQFEDLYKQPPDWYHGNWSTFNTIYLANSIGDFASTSSTTFNPPSSSGSSGFSGGGGGFSGGGGGGGGGGGW